jgi:predicted dehydrogenase
MSSDINVAIVGAGRMAREHIRAFSDLPGVSIVGITSRTLDSARALADEFRIAAVCKSIPELYECTRPQLAVVTVSAESMCAVACQCFEFEWDLLLEKPPGGNLGQSEIIYAASQRFSRKVLVGLNRRFLSSTQAALADLNKRPGPRHIQVLDQLDPALTASFGHPSQILENLMFFSSIHLIDYFSVFGRGSVQSVEPIFAWNASKPWVVSAAVRFDSGDTGLYQAVYNAPGPWAVAVNTRKVRWDIRPLERATYQLTGERSTVEVELSEFDKEFKPGFRLQAEQVVGAVLGRSSQVPTLAEALQTMRLISMIYGLDRPAKDVPSEIVS